MVPRKQGNLARVSRRQRQTLKRLGCHLRLKVNGEPEFAEALLQPDLPEAHRADKYCIFWFTDEPTGQLGKGGRVPQPPQKQMRIQEDSQSVGSRTPNTSAIS